MPSMRLPRLRIVLAASLVAVVFGAVPHLARAASLNRGIVDVTTTLGYQSGSAAGTGMVLTSSGEILTNNHVIRGATDMRVIDTTTGRSYTATVVGYSVASDVAVLQIDGAANLHPVTIGNVSKVKLGQRVTAVGNAGGVGGMPKSAAGKVTGLGKSIVATDDSGISEQLVGLIRTSAPLQPGDSGGPLYNASGRVIGMNTAASASFQLQSANQAFAIPINRALVLAKQIMAGRASTTVHIGTTPFLGVSVGSANGGPAGALVAQVVPGAPADQAGIVAGDTITAVDGQPVTSYKDLSGLLLQHSAGDAVPLTWVDQAGTTQTASVQTIAGPPQ